LICGQTSWYKSDNPEAVGCNPKYNNKTQFNALAGSFRFTDGKFTYPIGNSANFWTSTPSTVGYAWCRYISYFSKNMNRCLGRNVFGLSVRCVKGELPVEKYNPTNVVIDIDKNVYKTVQIGKQVWMAENLNVSRYRNGDKIPQIMDGDAWDKLTSGAYCYYGNNPKNEKIFGKLYNFYAVSDKRNIAPTGWHVASDAEWIELSKYLISNGFNADGIANLDFTGKSLASNTGWYSSLNQGMIGCDLTKNNSSHFNALPGSFRFSNGDFTYPIRTSANFWTSTENNSLYAWNRYLSYDGCRVSRDSGKKVYGLSVRCIKD